MYKIALCCSAGMSTSMLVKKMQEAAEARQIDAEITAYSMSEFDEVIKEHDVYLLGPQVRFMLNDLSQKAAELNKKVEAIDPVAYGTMQGSKVLDQAIALIG